MTRTDRVIVNSGGAPDGRPVRRTSWGAVFAGALTALMVTLLLNLLFAGIGLQSFNPASEANTLEGFGTGSIVALVLTNILALFLGGYIAGRLAGSPRRGDSVIHGILTWGVLTLGTILLLSTAVGRIVGGVAGVVGNTVSTVASVAPEAADAALPGQGGLNVNNVQDQINQFLADAGVQNPEQTSQELIQRVTARVQAGESLTSPAAQEELTTFLAQNSELTEQEVEQQVQEFTQQAQQTADQVVETTEEATDIAGNVAFALFGALLLGAIVAIVGAVSGSPKDSYEARA